MLSIDLPSFTLPTIQKDPTIQKALEKALSLLQELLVIIETPQASSHQTSNHQTNTLLQQQLVEFYSTLPKHEVPGNLLQTTILKQWKKGRLTRWWAWLDIQVAELQKGSAKIERRRHFLSRIRTHAWISDAQPKSPHYQFSPAEQRQLRRIQVAKKLCVDGTLCPVPLQKDEIERQRVAKKVVRSTAISRLSASRTIPRRSNHSFGEVDPSSSICSSHRVKVCGSRNTGSLCRKQRLTISAAQEALDESREALYSGLNAWIKELDVSSKLQAKLVRYFDSLEDAIYL